MNANGVIPQNMVVVHEINKTQLMICVKKYFISVYCKNFTCLSFL